MPAPPLPLAYRLVRAVVGGLLRLFFRDVAVEGARHVPRDRGGLLVAWHPNGLIDPALIFAYLPAQVVFGARDGLFRWPLLGTLMRRIGTVPIYRAVDAAPGADADEARREANARSLEALAAAIAGGRYAALFPEGHSHDLPYPTELKTGAARLYLRAVQQAAEAGRPTPALVPVGLHYDDKDSFRSDVLVRFHRPLRLPPSLLAAPLSPAEARAQVGRLTALIEQTLVETVHATDSWELHAIMHRARTLMRAEAAATRGARLGPETVAERHAGFGAVWHGYQRRRATHPEEVEALRRDLEAYDAGLRALALDDADLDQPPLPSPARFAALVAKALAATLFLRPLVELGLVVNAPPYWALKPIAQRLAKAEKDVATVKLFAGAVLFPLAWLAAALLAVAGMEPLRAVVPGTAVSPWLVGGAVFLLSALGGALALLASEAAQHTWQRVRARLTRLRHPERIGQLRAERALLHDRFVALAERRAPASAA
ncbi:MAG: 1-acyl-sn-glycerol-3-phosphate acyltransferase [Rubricoccaceae bacterium]